MAATMATMAILNAKCLSTNNAKASATPSKPAAKSASLLSLPNLPKGLQTAVSNSKSTDLSLLSGTAIAGAVFSTLSSCDAAFAAQQIADLAERSDNRGLALLLPITPAIAWVLYNILQPALNQINRMRSDKAVMIGIGLGGLSASGFLDTPEASAATVAAANDNRGQLLLLVVLPAIGWVLYNILQPALNQLNKMRSQ